jgi:hypothetical protein
MMMTRPLQIIISPFEFFGILHIKFWFKYFDASHTRPSIIIHS